MSNLNPYRAGDQDPAPEGRVFGPLVLGVDVARFLRIAETTQHFGPNRLRWYGIAFKRWAIGFFVLTKGS